MARYLNAFAVRLTDTWIQVFLAFPQPSTEEDPNLVTNNLYSEFANLHLDTCAQFSKHLLPLYALEQKNGIVVSKSPSFAQ